MEKIGFRGMQGENGQPLLCSRQVKAGNPYHIWKMLTEGRRVGQEAQKGTHRSWAPTATVDEIDPSCHLRETIQFVSSVDVAADKCTVRYRSQHAYSVTGPSLICHVFRHSMHITTKYYLRARQMG
jgi:hypothetical protein